MELHGKTVLILGGAGLVGHAICRELCAQGAGRMILTSLKQREADACCVELRRQCPDYCGELIGVHGDLFVPVGLQEVPKEEMFSHPRHRQQLQASIFDPLEEGVLDGSLVYRWCAEYRPDIVVDCINTATAMAYQDLYSIVEQLKKSSDRALVDRLLCALPLPQLVRHVQVLWESMRRTGTAVYLKIGTTGTGGMGLNIPYTHSEPRATPSLLLKSAVAGAHSMLLFLLARTPGGPVVKELKPAAFIAWKKIGAGPILRRGAPIPLQPCPLNAAKEIAAALAETPLHAATSTDTARYLEAPYVDCGENGWCSVDEFALVTERGQMEFITPDEIAQVAIGELQGRSTGHEIVTALDSTTIGPSYGAGILREALLGNLRGLERTHAVTGVSFGTFGPTTAKLLYEAYLLTQIGDMAAILRDKPEDLSESIWKHLSVHEEIRSRIISIGVPILLPNGRQLLRGRDVLVPTAAEWREHKAPGPTEIDRWADAGWIDLRPAHWRRWQERIGRIQREEGDTPWQPTPLVSWIYRREWEGARQKR